MALKLGFFASHTGSNMQAIVDACRDGRLAAEPCVVVSNNRGSEALERASRENIPACHLSSKTHADPDALDVAILQTLRDHEVELVVLAGYMRKIGPKTLMAYCGRILNIHPALLPKFGGKGMYGMRVHEAVVAAGDKETGVTVHVATEDYDQGPIVAQCRVPVLGCDTPETLAKRVLAREHEFFVETLSGIAEGRITLPCCGRTV
jgi:phosphoribosylglycinamide formyltransferase 1